VTQLWYANAPIDRSIYDREDCTGGTNAPHDDQESQEEARDALGLTFPAGAEIERATNRIGASRLTKFPTILQVPVEFFFEGLPNLVAVVPRSSPCAHEVMSFVTTSDAAAESSIRTNRKYRGFGAELCALFRLLPIRRGLVIGTALHTLRCSLHKQSYFGKHCGQY